MKITKRSDGRYTASIQIDGKRKYFYADTEKELEKKIIKYKYEIDKGIHVENSDMTFRTLAEKWFEAKQKRKEYNTKIAIQRKLKNHIYPALGYMKIKSIKTYHIQELINSLVDKGFTDTTTKVYQHINSILQFAVDNDLLVKNVAQPVELPKFKTKEKEILTNNERAIIEEVAKTHKHGDMIMMFLYTGLRREELIPLSKEQIKDSIIINRAMCFQHNQAVIKGTKNGEQRNIPILNKTAEIIKRRKNMDVLFPMTNGKMMSETSFREAMDSFREALDKYCDTKGIPHIYISAHKLRHTFCTLLYEANIPLKDAQKIMGHKSAKVTLDIYTHLSESSTNDSKNKIDNFLA